MKQTRAADIWTPDEEHMLDTLDSPGRIQEFLDALPYSTDPVYRCPRSVLRDRRAHCFDGAVFAAAALERLGHLPLVLDLRAVRDDDHVIALFRRDRHWGAVAKSNCAGLRFREPIHRSFRELALSYFEFYFNVQSEKTLRGYSPAVDLRRWDAAGWRTGDAAMAAIADRLDAVRHDSLLSPAMIGALRPVDPRTYAAGLLGADDAGLFRPESR
jgi:hypothetical protein